MDKQSWQQIENLFNSALALPPPERLDYLNTECGENKSLLASVLSLLEHSDHTAEIQGAVEGAAESFISETTDLTGELVGLYRIIKKLGQGGMGTVYLAERHDQQFNKQVAIKVLNSSTSNVQLMQRFKVERQILANLEHPYVARLIDGGTSDSGTPYLVMEYIDGQTIDLFIKQNDLSVKQRLLLFQKICSAVQYAHQNLVIHRDIKPSNILVTEDGEPRLLDFGIAKLIDEKKEALTQVETRLGDRILTPQYSSPEQIMGDRITTTSDVYSLGVLLFELLTEETPYGGTEKNRYSVEKAILEQQPQSLNKAITAHNSSLNKVNQTHDNDKNKLANNIHLLKHLSSELDNIVMKSLRKEPERRYQSVGDFSEDIENYLNNKPVTARSASWSYLVSKFIRRNQLASGLALLLLVAILGSSLAIFQQSQQVIRERDLAELQKAKAEAITEFFTNMFSAVDPDNAQGEKVSVREVLDKASEKLSSDEGHAMAEQPLVEAAVRRKIGVMYQKLGVFPASIVHLKKSLEIYRAHPNEDLNGLLDNLKELGNIYSRSGKHNERLPLLIEAVELSKKIHGDNGRKTLGMLINLGGHYNNIGESEKAIAIHEDTYEKAIQNLGEDDLITILSLASLGADYVAVGKYELAIEHLKMAFEQGQRALGPNNYLTLYSLGRLSGLLDDAGNIKEAIELNNLHLARSIKVLGEEHPDTLESMYRLAYLFYNQNQLNMAEEHILNALAGQKVKLGIDHSATLRSQDLLARILFSTGRIDEAYELAMLVYEKQNSNWGLEHQDTLPIAQFLAKIYFHKKQLNKALDLQISIHVAASNMYETNSALLYLPSIRLAETYLNLMDSENSAKYLKQAMVLAEANSEIEDTQIKEFIPKLLEQLEAKKADSQFKYFKDRLAGLAD